MKTSRQTIWNWIILIYLYFGFVTLVLWFLEKDYYSIELNTSQILIYLGQLTGFLSIVFLSLNYVIAARFRFIEKISAGLDKQYRLHMYTGILSFFLIIAHPLLLALPSLEFGNIFRSYFIPYDSNSFGRNSGILAFWLLTILLFISSSKKLSYIIWKMTHSLLGIPMLFISAHVVLVGSASEYMPLELWTAFWIVAGIGSYIYKTFLYDFIGPVYTFTVAEIKRPTELLHEIFLKPIENKKFSFEAGQFAFLQIINKNISLEQHPFTMSSVPEDEYLKFSIKELGDWSTSLEKLNEGDKVKVTGPYGHFSSKHFRNSKKQVWIGGGIGITPFLSKAKSQNTEKTCDSIYLIYSEKTKENAVFEKEIKSYDKLQEHLNCIIHFSDEQGYLTADQIEKWVNVIEDTVFLMCGPKPMTDSLSKQLIEKGVSKNDIVYEYFDFK